MSRRKTRNSNKFENDDEIDSTKNQKFVEFYNGQKVNVIEEETASKRFQLQKQRSYGSNYGLFVRWRQLLTEAFLPKGFPSSVTPDYIQYQIWDTIQAFASSLSGTLSTAAVLKGAGVGDETATVLAASLSWILKDGIGMLGRILFAWAFGTALDSDCKRWRLIADFLNDLAFCIDLTCTHTSRHLFMFTVCCSSLMRAIVGVAGGGTRMAVIRHQARRENLADVAAKDGSQETLVGILSLISSFFILPIVDGRPDLVWTLFFTFTFIHLLANYFAVRSLQFDIFNEQRLKIVANHFHETQEILTVPEANQHENIISIPFIGHSTRFYGCSLLELNKCHEKRVIYNDDNELKAQIGWAINEGNDYGVVAVHDKASVNDLLIASFGLELQILKNKDPSNLTQAPSLTEFSNQLKQKGWNVDSHLLPADEFTFNKNN